MQCDVRRVLAERGGGVTAGMRAMPCGEAFDAHYGWDLTRLLRQRHFPLRLRYSEVLLLADQAPFVTCSYRTAFCKLLVCDVAASRNFKPFVKAFCAKVHAVTPSLTKSAGESDTKSAHSSVLLTNLSREELNKNTARVSPIKRCRDVSTDSLLPFVRGFLQSNFEGLPEASRRLQKAKSFSLLRTTGQRNIPTADSFDEYCNIGAIPKQNFGKNSPISILCRKAVSGQSRVVNQHSMLRDTLLRKTQSLHKLRLVPRSEVSISPAGHLNETLKKCANPKQRPFPKPETFPSIKLNCFLSRQRAAQKETMPAFPSFARKSLDQYVRELSTFSLHRPHRYLESKHALPEARLFRQTPSKPENSQKRKSSVQQKIFDLRVK